MTLVTLVTRNWQDWKMEKESAQYWIDDDVVLCFGHPSAFSCSVSAPSRSIPTCLLPSSFNTSSSKHQIPIVDLAGLCCDTGRSAATYQI